MRPDPENAKRVLRALVAFGAPIQELTEADLVEPGLIFQIGVSPVHIDIITSIEGVGFDAAWPARVLTKFADQPVSVLSKQHLIQNKRATGRTQDLADLERLEGIETGDR